MTAAKNKAGRVAEINKNYLIAVALYFLIHVIINTYADASKLQPEYL